MRRVTVRGVGAAAMFLAASSVAASAVLAQGSLPSFRGGSATGIGYAGAIPAANVGGGVWHMFGTSGIGLFADAKLTLPRIPNDELYCPEAIAECSLSWVRQERGTDFALRDESDYVVFNGGGMYAISDEFVVTLGAGMVRDRRYRLFTVEQSAEPVNDQGSYYVPAQDEPEWTVQGVVGFMIRAGQVAAFNFGYETGVSAVRVGIYLVFQ